MQQSAMQRPAARASGPLPANRGRRAVRAASSARERQDIAGVDGVGIARVLAAAAAVGALLGGTPGAARAAADDATAWKPRRHHRHIGQRFSDTWADAVVEVQETDRETIRELQRQLAAERRRADEEGSKRRAAEQKARAALLQAAARSPYDDAAVSVRVAGADVTGPLVFIGLAAGGWWAVQSDLLGALTGRRRRGRGGRWVYDRSLGGKKVWVPDDEAAGGDGGGGALPPAMSDADFAALAATAATKAGGGGGGAGGAGGGAGSDAQYEPPAWWQRPGVLPVASEAARAALRADAERVLRRVEAAKNRGQDYSLEDILALRAACMAAGGASLETRTVGARDAIYRAAVDAGIKSCADPGAVDLGGYTPLRLAAGVASDVGLAERRAVSALRGAVAGACRGRIVDAIATLEKGDEAGALPALAALSGLLAGMPVLEAGSSEVQLVGGELNSWAAVAARERILLLMLQIADESQAELVARLLDLPPEDALRRARAALAAGGGGGGA